jgi:hypothetical protein
MPHLQLELTSKYPLSVKRDLAKRLGDLYGAIMQTTPDLVDVSFRELGEGNVWRCEAPGPVPSAVLICDIRAGRPPEQRARLGGALLTPASRPSSSIRCTSASSSPSTQATKSTGPSSSMASCAAACPPIGVRPKRPPL